MSEEKAPKKAHAKSAPKAEKAPEPAPKGKPNLTRERLRAKVGDARAEAMVK